MRGIFVHPACLFGARVVKHSLRCSDALARSLLDSTVFEGAGTVDMRPGEGLARFLAKAESRATSRIDVWFRDQVMGIARHQVRPSSNARVQFE